MRNIDHCLPSREDYEDAGVTYIPHRKCGAYTFDESSTLKWVIFSRAAVEAVYGAITDENAEDIAQTLTGWYRSYSGPGRGFSHDPTIRVYKRNIIIRQSVGIDI